MVMNVTIPEGNNGAWTVERFYLNENDIKIHNLRETIHGSTRTIAVGHYTQLTRHGILVMSDTPAELADIESFIRKCHGNILIAGLGLGLTVEALLENQKVGSVDVIEISSELIDLVGQHYQKVYGSRLNIVNADIFEWKPGKLQKWNFAWFDIWDNICTDNLLQMTKLKRRFCKRVNRIEFWAYVEHLRAKRRWMY